MEHKVAGEVRLSVDCLRIIVLGERDIYVEGLRHVLLRLKPASVVCVTPGEGIVNRIRDGAADVLLVQATLLKDVPAGFLEVLSRVQPDASVLAFGPMPSEVSLGALARAGVRGHIAGNAMADELAQALLMVRAGGLWFSPALLARWALQGLDVEAQLKEKVRTRISEICSLLSNRETAVLELILEGIPTPDIAARMNVSQQTVKLYVSRLFDILEARNRTHLVLRLYERICPTLNLVHYVRDANKTKNESCVRDAP